MSSTGKTVSLFTPTTIPALAAVASIVLTAYLLARLLLPTSSTTKTRLLFIWHMFDALVHFTLEGSFLYHCFYSSVPKPTLEQLPTFEYFPIPMTPQGVSFLSDSSRLYGPFYSNSFMAKLWQEYAVADRRWGGSDLTIISLEFLTVFVMAPLSIYICYLLSRGKTANAWFWMVVVATGELYGGFMTFAPEWLSGNPNLDTSNFILLWIYLVGFNAGLWVLIPVWVIWEAFNAVQGAFVIQEAQTKTLRSGKKRA